MPDCSRIDALVTPFVDGELPERDSQAVSRHLTVCPPCRAKVAAERAVRALIRERRSDLGSATAPPSLKTRCAMLRSQRPAAVAGAPAAPAAGGARASRWEKRLAPFALAASLLLALGGMFLYQATRSSSGLMAAELVADHEKCFRLNRVLGTHHSRERVRASMWSLFGWNVQLPDTSSVDDVELVGSRPCLYGEGRVAHIMYTHNGHPVSLFMLPRETRDDQIVEVFGHLCQIWSEGDRTFVLVSEESEPEMQRMAALVRTTIH